MFAPGNFLPQGLFARAERSRWAHIFFPAGFLPLVRRLVPWLASGAFACCALGFYLGFFVVPLDARHGDLYRIIYVHVPATWMAVIIYMLIAFWSGVGLLFNARLAAMLAEALAPTGAMFAFMALWTGSLWGKPIWGAWWVWDMRLVADLVLLFLYLAIVALHAGIENLRRADRLVAVLALAGLVIVAAMLASVTLWPRLHQNPSFQPLNSSGSATTMLVALTAVAAGFWMYSSAMALLRLRCVLLERERQSEWVAQCIRGAR
jgi:heme exporter protein C